MLHCTRRQRVPASRSATHAVRSGMNDCLVTNGAVRGTDYRRTNAVSDSRATLHGLPFPVSDTLRRAAFSAPFLYLLVFGKDAPHRGNATRPISKQGKAPRKDSQTGPGKAKNQTLSQRNEKNKTQ